MTITEFAEVGVPIIEQTFAIAAPIFCAECGLQSDQVTLAKNQFECPSCLAKICVMCGCTQSFACIGGCYWLSPGICSSHKQELQEMAAKVFGGLKR